MERWRWLPQDQGSFYITVNVPEFTLRVVEDAAEALAHADRGEIHRQAELLGVQAPTLAVGGEVAGAAEVELAVRVRPAGHEPGQGGKDILSGRHRRRLAPRCERTAEKNGQKFSREDSTMLEEGHGAECD